jgi:hypothetical protein
VSKLPFSTGVNVLPIFFNWGIDGKTFNLRGTHAMRPATLTIANVPTFKIERTRRLLADLPKEFLGPADQRVECDHYIWNEILKEVREKKLWKIRTPAVLVPQFGEDVECLFLEHLMEDDMIEGAW